MNEKKPNPVTRAALARELVALGLAPGDVVMVHASMRRIGHVLGGPDAFIAALREVVGAEGTVLAYTDWATGYEELRDASGALPAAWREHVPPFDAASSRAARDNGVFAEFLRTTPGALRSGNPGASVAALGAQAAHLTRDHALDYGYGERSPFARLVAAKGKVLMAGAPLDTMTLLHHAEHLAKIPEKRIVRTEVPFAWPSGIEWRWVEEFDTAQPVVAGLADDYFAVIVEEFMELGGGRGGVLGAAPSVLVDAAAITDFAVKWLEGARPTLPG